MELFINNSLRIYPRHPGDIKLIDPQWEEGKPLPEGWEEVIPVQPPEVGEGQTWDEVYPANIDGVWYRQFLIRNLTPEEIAQRNPNITPEVE